MPISVHIDSHRTWGGGQAQSLGLALALAERGETVWFVAQPDSALAGRLASSGLPWESIAMRGMAGAAHSLRLRAVFSRLRPDIVHLHDSAAQVPAIIAAGGRGRSRPRVIVTRRTDLGVRRAGRASFYGTLCDRVICISEAVERRLLEAGVPPERLAVIPDFVDCAQLDPEAMPAVERDPRPTVAIVGRLTREKGHEVLVRAMAKVVREIPDARLLICGEGEEEQSLRRQAEAEGIRDAVEFLGFVPDVRPVLSQADVFAMPSLSEGLGVAVLEAMAMGRPVVASDAGGLPESVVHGETGLVVPRGNAAALAGALVGLLRDGSEGERMGAAGRRRALNHFDRGPVVDRVVALYREVVSGAG